MHNTLNRTQIGDGVCFSSITDTKFKHNHLAVHFILPLDINSASNNAMVPLLLRKGTKDLPNFSAFNAMLENLYGATLGINISRFNRYQRVGVFISFLDNRYAMNKEDMITLCTEFLLELIFNPNLDDNGLFTKQDTDLERQYLIDTIEAEINDKRSYALIRLIEEMYRSEPISVPTYGNLETAAATTPQSVTNAWKDMLTNAVIEVIFAGSGSPDSALERFQSRFSNFKRNPIEYSLLKLDSNVEKVNEVIEPMENLQQGKLVMGMRVAGLKNQEQVDAGRVFSAIYGGTPFSKLFLNVREKLSLCYYCAARLDNTNNLLVVDSGVERENVVKAKEEIIKQLNSIKNGEITEEDLANTKLLLSNAIANINDSLSSIESWYLSQILKGDNISPDEDIANINKITKKQVVAVANGVNLDTIYLLTGEENA